MKTASIRVYHIFGTKGEYCGDVFYRNKLLYTLSGIHPGDILKVCQNWALNSGFTHVKTYFG